MSFLTVLDKYIHANFCIRYPDNDMRRVKLAAGSVSQIDHGETKSLSFPSLLQYYLINNNPSSFQYINYIHFPTLRKLQEGEHSDEMLNESVYDSLADVLHQFLAEVEH